MPKTRFSRPGAFRRFFLGAAAALLFLSPLRGEEVLQEILVREGDTIWSIAQHYLKDPKRWPELLKYNPRLSHDPTVALPGMRLRVPLLLIKEHLRAVDLIDVSKDVRYRRRQANVWEPARANMQLFNQDGLRTSEGASAQVSYPGGETVRISENSFIVIRLEKQQDSVELLSGDARARQARIITAGGARIDPLGTDSDYQTRIKPDRSELVFVFKGRVDVTAQGKTVRVSEGFGSEIRPFSPPSPPVSLPDMPSVSLNSAPPPGEVFVKPVQTSQGLVLSVEVPSLKDIRPDKRGPEDADNRAKSVSNQQLLDKYHLEVDDQPDFKSPVVSKYFSLSQKLNLHQLNLPEGNYWWRVAFVDSLGLEGRFSEGQAFQVDKTPPSCVLTRPEENEEVPWDAKFVEVAGRVDADASVRVNNKDVSPGADGFFSTEVYLHEGKNRIAVAAQDASGNTSRLERVVYRLLPDQKGRSSETQARHRKAKQTLQGEQAKESTLASVGIGVLAIGTIIGVILLIF